MQTDNINDLIDRDSNELLADLGAAALGHAALPFEADGSIKRRKALSEKVKAGRAQSDKGFLRRVGQTLFSEIVSNLYDLVCAGTDKELKDKVDNAISSGTAAFAAFIHTILLGIGIDFVISLLVSVIFAKSTTAASHKVLCTELMRHKS